jgi:hypothetical protein
MAAAVSNQIDQARTGVGVVGCDFMAVSSFAYIRSTGPHELQTAEASSERHFNAEWKRFHPGLKKFIRTIVPLQGLANVWVFKRPSIVSASAITAFVYDQGDSIGILRVRPRDKADR